MDGSLPPVSREDPPGLEQPPDDVLEQREEVPRPAPDPVAVELPLEADPADVAEQWDAVPAVPPPIPAGVELPLEADPADVVEQLEAVPEVADPDV
jgi:hypothetical protein